MKPPTCPTQARPFHALLLLFLLALAEVGTAGAHSSRTGRYHNSHHIHHDEHRAPRIRREQDTPVEVTTGFSNGASGTDTPEEIIIKCLTVEQCAPLINGVCDSNNQVCICPTSHPIKDDEHSYCLQHAALNQTCQFTSQCRDADDYSICGSNKICVCREGYKIAELPNIGFNCASDKPRSAVDPAMIGVLAGLALMFVIICVVLRLFSKARFRDNRSIFNTPNPRLMNASLFKDIDVAGGRRGSAMSAVSATGSASGTAPAHPQPPTSAKDTDSPSKDKKETTVAIENVD